MKKTRVLCLVILTACVLSLPLAGAQYHENIIERIRLSSMDVPPGFIHGQIPNFAKKVLKGNPWTMDKQAIRRLAGKIYPNGSYSKIAHIHVNIMARKNTPYGDDIVCYIILYNNLTDAKGEIQKLNEFVQFNRDRAIVLTRDNIAIFLHVDDVTDFPLIREMSTKFEKRLKEI